jgi:tRNA1Val (adenine37-N6)-methyltransferase
MKVCTDSCLFGAWIAKKIENKVIDPQRILDIGSGTGLLSLLIAQKSESLIDAVEIDQESFGQTVQNFMESPYSSRLQAYLHNIKDWKSETKYDLIISNPPLFENDLKSEKQNKNAAKHSDHLSFSELLFSIKNHLAANGNFAVLLPFHRNEYFKKLAGENDFFLKEELLVKQTPSHSYFRSILFFSLFPSEGFSKKEIIIKDQTGNYTGDFKILLKDYYLNL